MKLEAIFEIVEGIEEQRRDDRRLAGEEEGVGAAHLGRCCGYRR